MARPAFPELLLDDRLAPITEELGFLDADYRTATAAFVAWQTAIGRQLGFPVTTRPVQGTLEPVLRTLLPLTSPFPRRCLFVPTASAWTADFEGRYPGPTAEPEVSVVAGRLGCRWLRMVANPHRVGARRRPVRRGFGAIMLEVGGPPTAPMAPAPAVRSLIAVRDQWRHWTFLAYGPPLPFEQPARDQARRVSARFPLPLLGAYLAALGVRAFEEAFYLPEGEALLVELGDERLEEHPLAEAHGEEEGTG